MCSNQTSCSEILATPPAKLVKRHGLRVVVLAAALGPSEAVDAMLTSRSHHWPAV